MDSEVEMALATIMSYDIYSGEVVERTRNVENATTVLMCVRETKHPDCIAVPDFITTLQCYTEKDCRAICLELTKCIEILHNAGIAHRNLHLDNVQIDLLVRFHKRVFLFDSMRRLGCSVTNILSFALPLTGQGSLERLAIRPTNSRRPANDGAFWLSVQLVRVQSTRSRQ